MNKYLKILNLTYGFCITQLLIRLTDMAYSAPFNILYQEPGFIKNSTTVATLLLMSIILIFRINLKKYFAIPLALGLSTIIMILPSGFYILRQQFLVISYLIILITWIVYVIQSKEIKKRSKIGMLLLFSIPITITIYHPIVMGYMVKDISNNLNSHIQNTYNTTKDNLSVNQRMELQNSDFYKKYQKQKKLRFQTINLIVFILICLIMSYSAKTKNIFTAIGFLLLSQYPGFLGFEVPLNFLNINMFTWIFLLATIALSIILYGIRKWNNRFIH
jgi:hypothetical protein